MSSTTPISATPIPNEEDKITWERLSLSLQNKFQDWINDLTTQLNTDVNMLTILAQKAMPIGTIITFYGQSAPDGFFFCDGSTFDSNRYPQLYTVLNNSSNLPDLRGYFPRFWDNAHNIDGPAPRNIGSIQGDAIRNITGTFVPYSNQNGEFNESNYCYSGAFYQINGNYYGSHGGTDWDNNIAGFDASRQVPVSNENRPKNVCLMACIKHDVII